MPLGAQTEMSPGDDLILLAFTTGAASWGRGAGGDPDTDREGLSLPSGVSE